VRDTLLVGARAAGGGSSVGPYYNRLLPPRQVDNGRRQIIYLPQVYSRWTLPAHPAGHTEIQL